MNETVHTIPEVELRSNTDISAQQPILIAITDQDAVARKEDFASILALSICAAYPGSYKIVPETALAEEGRISMHIKVRRLGAFFNRTPNSVLLRSGYETVVDGDYSQWQKVIVASIKDKAVIAGTVGGPAGIVVGWSGITFLDIEVTDMRNDKAEKFILSLAAERSTPNTFGIGSAYENAKDAWGVVQPQLNRFLEASAQKVAAEKTSGGLASADAVSCL
ncbi:MAG: hypothetical protein NXI13_06250 [Proteobacteria bacterium]|nr:hypothetical protein [Pseudomonadota bacterium]